MPVKESRTSPASKDLIATVSRSALSEAPPFGGAQISIFRNLSVKTAQSVSSLIKALSGHQYESQVANFRGRSQPCKLGSNVRLQRNNPRTSLTVCFRFCPSRHSHRHGEV